MEIRFRDLKECIVEQMNVEFSITNLTEGF